MPRIVLAIAALLAVLSIATATARAQPPAGSVPRHCAMRAGREAYGPVRVGTIVILGVHTEWAGETNWAPEMAAFVGRSARVTQLAGVDTVGCPGLRVDADGGEWIWRLRDVQLAEADAALGIPRECGATDESARYGPLGPGSAVMLGAHTPWRGELDWTREMDALVGRFARITSLEGVDRAGCAVVRVDVDGGAHDWRVRDMVLAGSSLPVGIGAAVPRWCGMDDRSLTYGPIDEGSEIVLGRHSPWDGATNWSAEMERWVGRRARVTRLAGRDAQGCAGVRVDVDGGQFFWRLRDITF